MDLMTYALCKGNGGGGGSSNKFIVTLTPTSPDYSGTMDKTVAEINEAYEAGQQIVFRVGDSDVPMARFSKSEAVAYGGFKALMIDSNILLQAFTSPTNDGTSQDYGVISYHLTPVN